MLCAPVHFSSPSFSGFEVEWKLLGGGGNVHGKLRPKTSPLHLERDTDAGSFQDSETLSLTVVVLSCWRG